MKNVTHYLSVSLLTLLLPLSILAQNGKDAPLIQLKAKAPQHHLYVTPDGKIDCSDDEAFIKEAIKNYSENIKVKDGDGTSHISGLPAEMPEGISAATFSVTYTGFSAAAQTAFQRAVDIWSTLITSSITIRINANFSALDPGVLGSAGPNQLRGLTSGGVTTWYPDALADKLIGFDISSATSDIDASFSSSFTNFTFRTDGVPEAGKIDFVSVVMHEIGHGLGFLGSGRSGDGNAPCNGTAGIGCWGYVSGSTIPIIYDRFMQNGAGTAIMNTTSNANPSAGLHSFITTNNLFFNGTKVKAMNANNPSTMYAPTTYSGGSTYSHFDESTYNSANVNALMTPAIGANEVHQVLGPLGCALFQDIGWTMAGNCATVLAAELLDFTAKNADKVNILDWATGSERDNQMIYVERSVDAKQFITIGKLTGSGNSVAKKQYQFTDESPLSGINYYRLRFEDTKSGNSVSKVVSVKNGGKGQFVIQPTLAQHEITIVSNEAPNRSVKYEISDILGRVVNSGVLSGVQNRWTIPIADFTIGQYFIVFDGKKAQRFIKQ